MLLMLCVGDIALFMLARLRGCRTLQSYTLFAYLARQLRHRVRAFLACAGHGPAHKDDDLSFGVEPHPRLIPRLHLHGQGSQRVPRIFVA